MPRSTGTFSQYWDIQTTGNSSNNSQREEYIRVHLTGEVCRPEKVMVLLRKITVATHYLKYGISFFALCHQYLEKRSV